MFGPVVLLATFAASTALAAPSMATVEVSPKRDPEGFVTQIARLCLSSDKGKVQAVGAKLKVTDAPKCAKAIQGLATGWDHVKVATAAHVPIEKKELILEKMAKKHRALPLLGETGSCPCLAFSGEKSAELAKEAGK